MALPAKDTFLTMEIGFVPLYIVALHRLARLGKASRYAFTNNRAAVFELDGNLLQKKWVDLQDAERISILYHNDARPE